MHPEYDPATAGEIFNNTRLEAAPAGVDGRIGTQLSQPSDVQAAHNFFNSAGGGAQLPDLQLDMGGTGTQAFGGGQELSSLNSLSTGTGAESLLSNPTSLPTGMESSMLPGLDSGLMPGLEQGALAAVPGGEPISPLVQMILKMPGLTGIIGDFFSALMAFFFPADGGLLTLLDPSLWAAAAQNVLTSIGTVLMHDLPLTLTTMGTNNPFQQLLQNGLMETTSKAATAASPVTLSLEHQPFDLNSMNVGGSLGPDSSLYEMTSMDGNQLVNGGAVNIDMSSNKFIAMEGGNSFGPTLGSSSVPTAQMQGPTVNTVQMQQPVMPNAAPQGGGEAVMQQQPAGDVAGDVTGGDRGSLINDSGTAGDGTQIADAGPAHHMVERGDNLWNIAKEHLGQGSRWTEIYDLNKDIIGNNPDLIYSGQDLQLPGGADNIASSTTNYTVQPGDNLWNISRDHLGGGQNWHSIYDQNANVIGTNPDLIHPGQNLAISNGGGHMQVAQAPTHHVAPTHHATAPAHHAPAHHATTAHHAGAAQHAQTAHHAQPHADQVAHAKPSTHAAGSDSAAAASPKEVAHTTDPAAGQAANAGVKTEELGKTAHAPEDMKQEIGLQAVAKSL